MSVIRFLASSLSLSIPVLLRMLPIFLMTGLVLFGAVTALIDYPGYLVFGIAVVFFPLIAFLSLCAIRAGLVHRRQSRGPELSRLVRKSLLLGLVQAGLFTFYIVLAVGAVAMTLRPASLAEWGALGTRVRENQSAGASALEVIWQLSPLLLSALIGASLIYASVYVAFSVPFAAHGASAGVNGPRHEFLFGLGRRFLPLSCVMVLSAIIYYGLPPILFAAILKSAPIDFGSLFVEGIWRSDNLSVALYLGSIALLNFWLWCWFGAASAVAYIDVRDHIEEEHQIAMGAIRATAGPKTDLAELMRSRTERLRSASAVPTATIGTFDDIDDPVEPQQLATDDLFEDVVADDLPAAREALVPEQDPLSPEEIEERFRNRFGSDSGSGLRGDLSNALREAADLEAAPAEEANEPVPIDPASLITTDMTGALESELVPPVEPDLHEAVPESEDAPEWLRKYMGRNADKTIFGKDKD